MRVSMRDRFTLNSSARWGLIRMSSEELLDSSALIFIWRSRMKSKYDPFAIEESQ